MSWSECVRRLGRVAVVAAVAVCAGCGFQLRGQATYHFKSIYVNAPGSPGFAGELRHALESSGSAALAEDPLKAEVILDIPLIVDSKDVLSLSSAGRVQEFALEKRVQMRLRNNAGVDWLPPDEIVIRRSYLYDDSERLARSIEESRLLREMQTDAVQQIMRRLQAARVPE
jgi:LPS-assembly lipoprotein